MLNSRIIGLDVGDAKIGVAISDLLGLTAQPLEVIRRDKQKSELSKIIEIVKTNAVSEIVVGLPRATDGNISEQGKKIKLFTEELQKKIQVKIIFKEEYLSTQRAQEILIEFGVRREKRKGNVDKIAASLILQGYLDGIQLQKRDKTQNNEQ